MTSWNKYSLKQQRTLKPKKKRRNALTQMMHSFDHKDNFNPEYYEDFVAVVKESNGIQ